MKHFYFRICSLLLLCGLSIHTQAYDCEVNRIFYNLNGNEATVTASPIYGAYRYNGDIVIPESISYGGKTYTVTKIGSEAFMGRTITSISLPNTIVSIGTYAFYSTTNLTSITIPRNLKTIERSAFYQCNSLKKIIIPDIAAWCSVDLMNSIFDNSALQGTPETRRLYSDENTEIEHLVIPDGVTAITSRAFENCQSIKSVSIPSSVSKIGSSAFFYCKNLSSLTLANGIDTIGGGAFFYCNIKHIQIPASVKDLGTMPFSSNSECESISIDPANTVYDSRGGCNAIIHTATKSLLRGCSSTVIPDGVEVIDEGAFNLSKIKSISIPSSVTTINSYAFNGCAQLEQITFGDYVNSIVYNAFNGVTAKMYVNKGSGTLLSLWRLSQKPYETGTDRVLAPPTVSVVSVTQTTATIRLSEMLENYKYYGSGSLTPMNTNEKVVSGLAPESEESLYVQIVWEDPVHKNGYNNIYVRYNIPFMVTTSPLNMKVEPVATATSITAVGSYTQGDADIVSQSVKIDGRECDGAEASIYGLMPGNSYTVEYTLKAKAGNTEKTYSKTATAKTSDLTMTPLSPKVISAGNVIVAASANISEEEQNVGFEWRRTDWTDDFASKSGTAQVYGNTMQGYIRSLNTEKLWKFRAYYEAANGTRFYSNWLGIDPSDYSYFEPTVYTYAPSQVSGNTVVLKGYAMRGTDNIAEQGFKYWKSSTRARGEEAHAPSIPSDAVTVEAEGTVMTVSLTGLDYESTYCFVAYVKTSENETFYGNQQTFHTGADTSGIGEVTAATANVTEVARYDARGRKLTEPQRGLNIIRMSDGTVRKVMVK
ncbi:MAG: leucine-rich repeat domain-containing protein [Prevotella sp.]|nr:leucine-rich repeat domain-containing protein [Prevotella sp.]